MYKFERNTKIMCIVLMIIGAIALSYGFVSASNNSYSDKEIKKVVKELYKQNSSKEAESNKFEHKEIHHGNDKHYKDSKSEDYHYASLFAQIEKKFAR